MRRTLGLLYLALFVVVSYTISVPPHVPMQSVAPVAEFEVPWWLGGYVTITNASSEWTLPLTYLNGGKTNVGTTLMIQNQGLYNITLYSTSPETIQGAGSYIVVAGTTVSFLSAEDWIAVSIAAVDDVDSVIITDINPGVGTYVTRVNTQRTVNTYTATVKDYGARGDDVTDDCAAFNNALINNAMVFVPAGVYALGCTVSIPSGRTLYSIPQTATLKRKSNAGGNFDMIGQTAAGTNNIVISGLIIDGNYQNQGSNQDYSLIELNDLGGSSNSTNVLVENCILLNTPIGTGQGILIAGYNGITVRGCTITGGGGPLLASGIYFRRSSVITVTDNHIYDFGGTGIHFVSATVGELGYALTISNNIIERVAGRGMVLSDVNGAVITGNVLNVTGSGLNSPNGEFGILISFTNGGSNDFLINSNTIYDNPGVCIAVYSAAVGVISGNVIRKCGTSNIMLRASTLMMVFDNLIHNPPDTVLNPYSLASSSAVGLITMNGGTGSAFISQNRIQSSVPTNGSIPQYSVWTDGEGWQVNLGVNVMPSANINTQLRFNASSDQFLTIQLPTYTVSGLPACGGSGTSRSMLAIATDAFTGPNTQEIVFCDSTTFTWKRVSDMRDPTLGKVLFTTDGGVFLGTGSALAVGATGPDMYMPASNGAPTGVPSAATAGYIACRYDTVNNKHCCYNGAWRCSAAYT